MRRRAKQHEHTVQFSNHLKSVRTTKGFSQGDLAHRAGITRQAVSSVESNLYLPTTAIAIRLASVLACRVEDLFSLAHTEDSIEGILIGRLPHTEMPTQAIRVKVSTVGKRTVVRPVADLGDQLSFAVPADGYATAPSIRLSGPFRDEIEALGGYDTNETGKLQALRVA